MQYAKKADSAVSPVIGTILMVAITVILVAIVAATVMPMVGGTTSAATVGVMVKPSSEGQITVTFTGGDIANIVKVQAFGPGDTEDSDCKNVVEGSPTIGQTCYSENGVGNEGETGDVKLVAYFSDGTQQIIWQGKLNFPTSTTTAVVTGEQEESS